MNEIKRYIPCVVWAHTSTSGYHAQPCASMMESPIGSYVAHADYVVDKQAAVEAERQRCREEEVAPLRAALRSMLENARDVQAWQSTINAVLAIQKEKP